MAVFSCTLTAAAVTEQVGVKPTTQRVKGEPVSNFELRAVPVYVPNHQWIWQPDDTVDLSMDAQLDSIWAALGSSAEVFKSLVPDAAVVVSLVINRGGSHLTLGWALARRHVAAAAAFGAMIDVDEYDDTEG
jgi:hypothetical protein